MKLWGLETGLLTSTTTSLLPMKRGMVEACTGVILAKPIAAMASSIHSASGGVSASHALGSFFCSVPGAMVCGYI